MRNASLYRVGGTALIAGGALSVVAVFLHAPQPHDLAAYGALAQTRWMASHWLFVVGATLIGGGLFAMARHLFSTKNEGWAVLGAAAILCSTTLFLAVVAPEIVAFPALLQSVDGSAPHAYTAVNLNLMSLMHVGLTVFWGGVGFLAFAMIGDPAFSRTTAQAGVAIAALEILVVFTPLGEQWLLFQIIFAAGYAWIALAGVALRNVKGAVPAY